MNRRPVPDGKPRIIPSLLAADFAGLRGDLAPLRAAGALWASVDVMDGHFVPNLSFGPDLVAALRTASRKPGGGRRGRRPPPRNGGVLFLDAHLMVDNPAKMAPLFVSAGADWVIVHIEACPRPRALLKELRRQGVGVGLGIKPETPVDGLLRHLPYIDLALVMTVEPGRGGQAFMADMMPKVRRLRREIDRRGLKVWIQVDGGINAESVGLAAASGADALVAGSALFRAKDPVRALKSLRRTAEENFKKKCMEES